MSEQQQSSSSSDFKIYLKRLLELAALGGTAVIGPRLGTEVYKYLEFKKPREYYLAKEVHPKYVERVLWIGKVYKPIPTLNDSLYITPHLYDVLKIEEDERDNALKILGWKSKIRSIIEDKNELLPHTVQKVYHGSSPWDRVKTANWDALKKVLIGQLPKEKLKSFSKKVEGKGEIPLNSEYLDNVRRRVRLQYYKIEYMHEKLKELPKSWAKFVTKYYLTTSKKKRGIQNLKQVIKLGNFIASPETKNRFSKAVTMTDAMYKVLEHKRKAKARAILIGALPLLTVGTGVVYHEVKNALNEKNEGGK